MAFFQRYSKIAFAPIGAVSSSIFVSRYSCGTTNQKVNQLATQRLNAFANTHFSASTKPTFNGRGVNCSSTFPLIQNQTRFKSSISKDASEVASQNTAKKSGGFLEWYERHLNARPVTTKAITGSILWGVGDFVAQVVPTFFQDESGSDGAVQKKEFKYDFPRTGRAVFFGFAIHAPLSHLHFNFLEWMTVKGGFTGLHIPVFKTFMEQFVYWSWFSNSLYHGAMGAMQGMNMTQIYDRIADVLWDTQVAQWTFWIPVQLLNFQFVPVRHQLNVVLLTSIAWTALLSAWYPPEEKSDEEDKKVDKA
mmetsp:Transcript_27230/g.57265  ORF Transcript_27230/g.57265 Transcript_27230/m.57265 type:complete len:306 (-) Transcript_27230:153-1070(-)|eukprot:CAMPEP_0171330756 /NCGR_PEP_ID=MMETSP0878-20121228/2225_1 /TAXON_ID=67004 /ORGANISM="Thalassiosira weissflogii, Strain CCMP1336" /LENGTH=305 /DNA_ID=CAMNT_0011831129 /DNA_START=88 /DNA_END=1005 /DNA_ORIENTATION=+